MNRSGRGTAIESVVDRLQVFDGHQQTLALPQRDQIRQCRHEAGGGKDQIIGPAHGLQFCGEAHGCGWLNRFGRGQQVAVDAAAGGIGHCDGRRVDPEEADGVLRVRHIVAAQADGRGQAQAVRARLPIPREENGRSGGAIAPCIAQRKPIEPHPFDDAAHPRQIQAENVVGGDQHAGRNRKRRRDGLPTIPFDAAQAEPVERNVHTVIGRESPGGRCN